jgi:ADP-heptose:LPS heptosyltransferase
MEKILIILWGGVGDVISATPTVKALRCKYPLSEITVIHSLQAFEIIKTNPNINKFVLRDTKAARNEIRNINRFDIVLQTRDQELDIIDVPRKQIIADKVGLNVNGIKNEIYLSHDEKKWAKSYVANFKNVILLQSCSTTHGGKQWEINKWEELVSRFNNNDFLLIGNNEDNHIHGTIDLRGKTTIRQAIALLNESNLFVGIDSFLNHATDATSTNGVVLFGSSNPKMWGYDKNINIYIRVSCSPCSTESSRKCISNICMNIPVDEVEQAVRKQLKVAMILKKYKNENLD